MRRLAITLLVLGSLSAAVPAWAQTEQPAPRPSRHIDVIEVAGLLDPVQADFVEDAVRAAVEGGAEALVVQLDSGGGVLSRGRLDRLLHRVGSSPVPVAVWVGPSGSRAAGQAFDLVRAAAISGVASNTRVGRGSLPAAVQGTPSLTGRTVSANRALADRLVEVSAPTLGGFIVALNGRQVGPHRLETAEIVPGEGEQLQRRPTVAVRFAKLGLLPRLLHTAASPSMAYLLLTAGLALVVLELYTAGIGVAAATGSGLLVLACYGLGVLPTRPYAVGLLLLGVVGYAIDVQAGAPRTWTVIGTVALAVGSVRLYGDGLAPSPLVLVVVVGGMALFMVAGMPAMVRARFSTPTIGRESMVGERGQALAAVDPDGTVEVRGAPWRARTNRATPIAAGEPVRVVGIDGLLLEVEPESGGARDYRKP